MFSILTPEKLCHKLSALLTEQCAFDKNCKNSIRVLKRQRDLKDGDFVVPPRKDANIFSEEVVEKCRASLTAALNENSLGIKSVSPSKHFPVIISLDRAATFKRVITSVCRQKNCYGFQDKKDRSPQDIILINAAGLVCQGDGDQSELPLTALRTLILLKHVRQLLKANGFDVRCIGKRVSPQMRKLMVSFEVDVPNENFSEILEKELKLCVLNSKYRGQEDVRNEQSDQICTRESTSVTMVPDEYVSRTQSVNDDEHINLDLRMLLTENPALRGYDKNVNTVKVINKGEATDVLKEVISLESEIKTFCKVSENSTSATTVLHLTSHSRGYFQQQVDLVWRTLSQDVANTHQVHLTHGTVQPIPKPQQLSAEKFCSQIREEIRQSTVVKYGDQVQGKGWERNIDVVTRATVMFDFLTSNYKNTLSLPLPVDGAGEMSVSTKRPGTFVMYNAARLSTLFTHFQKAVDEGQYPNLPAIEDVDFSLLKEEDEWVLLFNFVWPFPDIVFETVSNLVLPNADRITADIQTHKVCIFLFSLSQHLSAYYSRIHILGESRCHLYPLMFARLYLLRAVHQIYINGLSLLEIQPLSQL